MNACRGSTRCHELAAIVTNVIMTLARERASDGMLSIGDLERITALVGQGTIALDDAFRRHEEQCRRDHTRPKGNVGARSNPFQRLLVRPFEHLLTGDKPVFQRGWLPNYFEFATHALGDRYDGLDRHCKAIIQALLVIHGNNLTWDHFYGDQRTLKTLAGAMKVLTHFLGTPEGQHGWHASIIRPVGELPAPSVPQANQVRQALIETARGLAAAEK
ncbi:MAG: hypothetical protein ACM31L_07730 [Actinomycetota bacterium]